MWELTRRRRGRRDCLIVFVSGIARKKGGKQTYELGRPPIGFWEGVTLVDFDRGSCGPPTANERLKCVYILFLRIFCLVFAFVWFCAVRNWIFMHESWPLFATNETREEREINRNLRLAQLNKTIFHGWMMPCSLHSSYSYFLSIVYTLQFVFCLGTLLLLNSSLLLGCGGTKSVPWKAEDMAEEIVFLVS